MINGLDAEICLPLLFNGNTNVLKCLIHIASERSFDVLYFYNVGDITQSMLNEINAIETTKSWFSLYNNGMVLDKSDIYVPLF